MDVLKDELHETNVLHLRFRWVSLQLQSLCALRTEVLVRRRLGELPATLRELYQETYVKQLGGYEEEERLIAETILRLLMCLTEPLTTRDFLLALEFCGEERTLVSIEAVLDLCANFVVLDTELDVFRFAHLSVREFLEKKEGFDAASNHAIAAECCLRHLLNVKPRYELKTEDGWITEDNGGPKRRRRAAFWNLCHEYSCLYWLFHLSESSAHRYRPPLNALFWTFMLDDQNSVTRSCVYWIYLFGARYSLNGWENNAYGLTCGEFYGFNHDFCKFACLMLVASAWNFCDVLHYCISMDSDVVRLTHPISDITPLHVACRYGNVDAAKLLLDNGAGMELMDHVRYSPMYNAISFGHTMVVRLLLEKGANPNLQTSQRYPTYLCMAAVDGSLDIVKALFDGGADLDRQAVCGDTALDDAIYNGDLAMVRTMLERSGRTNEITNIPWIKAAHLIRALLNGDEADVSAMLRQWSITKVTAKYLDVALWRAARLNREKSMRLLLENGADMNSRFRHTPVLFAAAELPDCGLLDEGKCPLVQFLLRQGADPHMTCYNNTLLYNAIDQEKLGLARILLEEGADIDQGCLATPPLLHAAYDGSLDAARFLLQRGADIERRGLHPPPSLNGRTLRSALYWARKKKQWEMAQLLLEHGAKDGPDSCPHKHEPGSCPYGHGPGVCPHELRPGEDATDELGPFELDETPSDDEMSIESDMS